MPKAYWIAQVTVTDPEQYAKYQAASAAAFAEAPGRPLARAGRTVQLEGTGQPRNVVFEFDSLEAAEAFYHSPAYAAARALRERAGEVNIVVVEGL
jgi:uncharacterized protein (DUF1330 family)